METIALYQFDVSRADPEGNLSKIESAAVHASGAGASILFLPEMATTGFDWEANRKFLSRAEADLLRIRRLASHHGMAICGSFLEKTETSQPANTLCFIDKTGALMAAYRKVHLFTLFGEDRHMQAGGALVTAESPMGKVGFAICYDLRFPELFRRNTLDGAVVHVVPAAFPYPRLNHWKTLIAARAIENQAFVIATNQCGYESRGSASGEIQYFGHSAVIDPWGEALIEAGTEEGLHTVEVDFAAAEKVRNKITSLRDRRPELY